MRYIKYIFLFGNKHPKLDPNSCYAISTNPVIALKMKGLGYITKKTT